MSSSSGFGNMLNFFLGSTTLHIRMLLSLRGAMGIFSCATFSVNQDELDVVEYGKATTLLKANLQFNHGRWEENDSSVGYDRDIWRHKLKNNGLLLCIFSSSFYSTCCYLVDSNNCLLSLSILFCVDSRIMTPCSIIL